MRVRGFNNVGKAAQTYGSKIVALRFDDHETKLNVGSCWLKSLTGFKLCARATTCNKVYKRTQHVSSNNVGSCWPRKLSSFARGFTWQKRRKTRDNWLKQARGLPRDFQPIVCNALGCKEDPRIAPRQKTKKQVKILPYGALTWQVKVLTDRFLLKPRANGRNVVY